MVWPAGQWRSLFIILATVLLPACKTHASPKHGSEYGAAKLTAGLGLLCIYIVLGLQTLSMHDVLRKASTDSCMHTKHRRCDSAQKQSQNNPQDGLSLLISSTLSVRPSRVQQVCIRRPLWLSAGVKKSHWACSQITWYSYICSNRCCEKNMREEKKCQSRSGCAANRGNPLSSVWAAGEDEGNAIFCEAGASLQWQLCVSPVYCPCL